MNTDYCDLPDDEKASDLEEAIGMIEAADLRTLVAELDAIRHAAHMPDGYEHGLPSWINQHLYGKLMEWTDADGGPIRRSEDIEMIRRLRLQMAQLTEALEVAIE